MRISGWLWQHWCHRQTRMVHALLGERCPYCKGSLHLFEVIDELITNPPGIIA